MLIATIGIEYKALNSANNDFDYHWVGGLTNSTATVVVTVQPYRGTTLVEAAAFFKEYFRKTKVSGVR